MLRVKLDEPISRTADPNWAFYGKFVTTEAVRPLMKYKGNTPGSKFSFSLPPEWIKYIIDLNPGMALSKVFNKGLGPFSRVEFDAKGYPINVVMLAMTYEGNAVSLNSLTANGDGQIGIVRTLDVHDAPPKGTYYAPDFPGSVQALTLITKEDTLIPPYQGRLFYPLLSDGSQGYLQLGYLENFPELPFEATVNTNLRIRKGASTSTEELGWLYSGATVTITKYALDGSNVWGEHDAGWSCLCYFPNRNYGPFYYTDWVMQTPPPPLA